MTIIKAITSQAELAAADRTDLQGLGSSKGAAVLIITAARGTSDSLLPSSTISL